MDKLMLFCIKHEKTFRAEQGVCGLGHVDIWLDWELDFCCFPMGYAFSPPPEHAWDSMDFDAWVEWVDEPSVEDLEAAEQGAEEFMLTLELAGG